MAKTALVTGANSGIGKATAIGLAKAGYDVTLVARNKQRGEAALKDVTAAGPSTKPELLVCDLSSQASIRKAMAGWRKTHPKLDALVCCAGVFLPERVQTPDGLEGTFATNVMGYYLVTQELLPALRKAAPSRVVYVASKYGKARIPFDDLQFETTKYSYLRSTPPTMLGRVLLMQEFARRLKDDGITVNAIHPGLVGKTQLLQQTGGPFKFITDLVGGTPDKGADTAVWLATADEARDATGTMFHKRKPIKTPGEGSDGPTRERFWNVVQGLAKT